MKSVVYIFLVFLSINAWAIIVQSCCSVSDNKSTNRYNDEYLELFGKIIQSDQCRFELEVKRLKQRTDEYLPNSEDFRVEILNADGKVVFNSGFGMNFFQAIQKVKPNKIDDTHKYEYSWNYLDNFGKKVKSGNYKALLIIPSQPTKYSIMINFEVEF